MERQVKMLSDLDLMKNIKVFFVTGENPNKENRNKDDWDRIDGDSRELECYEKVIKKFEEYDICKIYRFTNNYDDQTLVSSFEFFEKLTQDLI
jgi:hypothetical protein